MSLTHADIVAHLTRAGWDHPSAVQAAPRIAQALAAKQRTDRACSNCQRPMKPGEPLRDGRCVNCYRYYRREGTERPPELYRRTKHPSVEQPHGHCTA